MTRGEIWWVDFGLAYGSMPHGRSPAIIVQNDNSNASQIMTTDKKHGHHHSIDELEKEIKKVVGK